MKPLILIGGGGHCKACIDVIESENCYSIKGILDSQDRLGEKILDYEFIGDDRKISDFVEQGYFFLITIGQISSAAKRAQLFELLLKLGANMATVVSPRAYVSNYAKLGIGSVIMPGAIINYGASIGRNSIVNSGSIIEHDAIIGDHVHISTGAILNGNVKVGDGCFIGSNSVINEGRTIYSNCIVGSGSVVIHDLIEPGIYVGSPARKRK